MCIIESNEMQCFRELLAQYAHFWLMDEFQSNQMQLDDHLLEPEEAEREISIVVDMMVKIKYTYA